MRLRVGPFAPAVSSLVMVRHACLLFLLLPLVDTAAVARTPEGTIRLVCQLQKTEGRPSAADSYQQSGLERVEVDVVISKDQMTISGAGYEINFSVSSVGRDQVFDQGPYWGIDHSKHSDTGPIVENVQVGRPGKKPGMFYYNLMRVQKDLHQKKGFLVQTQITGKCQY